MGQVVLPAECLLVVAECLLAATRWVAACLLVAECLPVAVVECRVGLAECLPTRWAVALPEVPRVALLAA